MRVVIQVSFILTEPRGTYRCMIAENQLVCKDGFITLCRLFFAPAGAKITYKEGNINTLYRTPQHRNMLSKADDRRAVAYQIKYPTQPRHRYPD
jgi:hypothetical protein